MLILTVAIAHGVLAAVYTVLKYLSALLWRCCDCNYEEDSVEIDLIAMDQRQKKRRKRAQPQPLALVFVVLAPLYLLLLLMLVLVESQLLYQRADHRNF
eukprot:COSAG05_NODE_2548_length_2915_cov_2.008523_2_plen_99_part_00